MTQNRLFVFFFFSERVTLWKVVPVVPGSFVGASQLLLGPRPLGRARAHAKGLVLCTLGVCPDMTLVFDRKGSYFVWLVIQDK